MRMEVSFLVEQAKTLPLPFLAKATSVAIFVHWLVYHGTANSSETYYGVQLTRVGCTTGYN